VIAIGRRTVLALGHDHDPGLGYEPMATVGFQIVTDAASRIDRVVTVDYHAPQACPAPDHHVVHDDAVLQLDVFLDDDLAPDDGVAQRSALHKRAAADHAVADVAVDDPRGRALVVAGTDLPVRVEQVEPRLGAQHVLI